MQKFKTEASNFGFVNVKRSTIKILHLCSNT